MKRLRLAHVAPLCAAMILLAVCIAPSYAQTGNGYDLAWWTVDGGGGTANNVGSGYMLMGTVGQPDAGSALTSGDYTLVGGFWSGAGKIEYKIYLPLVLRSF